MIPSLMSVEAGEEAYGYGKISSKQTPLRSFCISWLLPFLPQETGEFLCDSPKASPGGGAVGRAGSGLCSARGDGTAPGLGGPGAFGPAVVTRASCRSVSPMETAPGGGVLLPHSAPVLRRRGWSLDAWGGLRFLVLDGVKDPGNVETILRTADAFEARVILLPVVPDLITPRPSAGMGVHFRSALYRCTLAKLTALLKAADLPLYGAALREDTADVRAVNLSAAP